MSSTGTPINGLWSEFTNSNSRVDILVFFVLMSLIFIILLQIIMYLTILFNSVSDSPILIDGRVSGNVMRVITQDPALKGSIPIKRSTHEDGIEFTWSTWLNINGTSHPDAGEYQHIFHKGDNVILLPTGMNNILNAPGLYLSSDNELVICMNTYDSPFNNVRIDNIPRNKWFNIIIRLSDQYTLDIYINGKLVKRHILDTIPKQNYGDVYVGMNGGFDGYISSLRYYSRALSNIEILKIMNDGPNLKLLSHDKSLTNKNKQQYLSLQWFLNSHSSDYT